MDGKDIQSDLHALKSLYGLLQKDEGEASDPGSDSVLCYAYWDYPAHVISNFRLWLLLPNQIVYTYVYILSL